MIEILVCVLIVVFLCIKLIDKSPVGKSYGQIYDEFSEELNIKGDSKEDLEKQSILIQVEKDIVPFMALIVTVTVTFLNAECRSTGNNSQGLQLVISSVIVLLCCFLLTRYMVHKYIKFYLISKMLKRNVEKQKQGREKRTTLAKVDREYEPADSEEAEQSIRRIYFYIGMTLCLTSIIYLILGINVLDAVIWFLRIIQVDSLESTWGLLLGSLIIISVYKK